MSPRAIIWTWVLFFEAVVGLVAFAGPPIVALGMNIGFVNGTFVVFVATLVDRRRKRCGQIAPVDAEVGMAGCERRRGHAPPHRANGSVW